MPLDALEGYIFPFLICGHFSVFFFTKIVQIYFIWG